MHKAFVLQGLLMAGLALGATTARADDFRGFYTGAGIGSNTIELDGNDFSDSDTGFKVFAGYSFGEFLALELGYIDGGTSKEDFRLFTDEDIIFFPTLLPVDTRVITELETTTFNLSVIGNLPLTESFALTGRLGYASIDQKVRFSIRGGGRTFDSFSGRDTEEEVSYGAGAVYSFGKSFQLRAEYEGFDVPNGRLDFISLSGVLRFR
jgi:OmpA-OmpF porin, OOP family